MYTIEYVVMFNSKKTASTIILMLFLSFSVPSFLVFPANATEDSWTTLEPMPTARAGLGVAVVDGKIYAIGGDRDGTVGWTGITEMYDPATDTWTTRTPMPSAREDFGIAVVQNKVYVIGGIGYVGGYPNLVGATEVYDTVTDTWETKTSIPTPRESLVANVVNGKIYIMAGDAYGGPPGWMVLVSKTEIYDPETDTWTTGASMPNFEGFGMAPNTASAVVDNKIYVIVDQTLRIYDPETDIWSNDTQMPTPRRYLGGAVINDRLYAIGGYVKSDEPEWKEEATDLNELYTPSGYVPEFPSWAILPLLFVATLVIIVCKKRLPKNPSNI
jgi:N-acetylneuraminic acid mutarotase